MTTTEINNPACASEIGTASGGTAAGVEADIAGARSVAVSVDAEDSSRTFIDVGGRAPSNGIVGTAVDVSDVLVRI